MAFSIPVRRGEDHPFAKISNSARVDCRRRWVQKEATIAELAREQGVTYPTMSRIVHDPTIRIAQREPHIHGGSRCPSEEDRG